MRYDAVLEYANEHSPSNCSFRLPAMLLSTNPVNKTATNSQNRKEFVPTDLESFNLLKDDAAGRTIETSP